MECLERFVIFMYDRAGNKTSVDETRKQCLYRKVEHMMLSHQPGGPVKAHKQSCLPSWSLVGPSADTMPRSPFTRGLRMDFERGRMAAFLDDASRCD